MSALPGTSDVNLFRYRERVVDLDAEVADRALNFRMAQQSRVIMHLGLTH
jgi:hypothetical protein